MSKRACWILWLIGMLSGCVPYPVYKTLRPAATATVVSASGEPVEGATVTLLAQAYPYRREKSRLTVRTGVDGVARFPRLKEWRTESLAIHGAEVFFWNWCVQYEGHVTVATNLRDGDAFDRDARFVLTTGTPTECPGLM